MQNLNRRVVVTGLSAITPIGLTYQGFWEALLNGVSGSQLITSFDTSKSETKFACELKGFDAGNYIDRKTARRLDPYAQYALVAAGEVLKDAGIDPEAMSVEEKERTGVVFGSGIGGIQTFYAQSVTNHTQGPSRVSPFFIPMLIPDMGAGMISITHGLKGPNYCIVSACATANNNIIDSFMLIKNGLTDAMITGGSEASICEIGIAGFNSLKALSTRNDSPETEAGHLTLTETVL